MVPGTGDDPVTSCFSDKRKAGQFSVRKRLIVPMASTKLHIVYRISKRFSPQNPPQRKGNMTKHRNEVYKDIHGIFWARMNGKRLTPNTQAAAQALYDKMLDDAERAEHSLPAHHEVIILRGVPGCGKTTWAREFIAKHYWYKRISRDAMREMFHFSHYDSQNERFIRDMRKTLIRECLCSGWSVVVDDTNCKERDVWDIQNAAVISDLRIDVRIVTFDTSLNECIERDARREHPIGEARIIEMWEQLNGRIMTPELWAKMVEAVGKV